MGPPQKGSAKKKPRLKNEGTGNMSEANLRMMRVLYRGLFRAGKSWMALSGKAAEFGPRETVFARLADALCHAHLFSNGPGRAGPAERGCT